MTKLQIAMDTLRTEEALALLDQIHDLIHIAEVGTPMIVRDGLHPVRSIKERYPHLTVLADVKIVDGGSLECGDACEAGADIITVLALADDSTVRAVADTAHRYGRKCMADLICVEDIAARSQQLLQLGVDYVCVHTAVDVQARGMTPLKALKQLTAAIPAEKAAVAGGVNLKNIGEYAAEQPAILIMGAALCNAEDVRQATEEALGHLNS